MNHPFFQKLTNWVLPAKNTLPADLVDSINAHQRVVIQKRLEAIAKDFEAQGVLAQLQYLQGIELSYEKTLSPKS